jgi:mono/diheme cytochrome c family protein
MNVNKPREDFTRMLLMGLAFTAVIMLAVGVYAVLESPRIVEASDESTKEAIKEGRSIYNEQCATCHGSQGEGGVGMPLNSQDLLKNTSDAILFSIIRSGVPMTQMPAWSVDYGGPLTDQDIRHVVAFIRDWEDEAPLIETPVFEPSAERGALIFSNTCTTCHEIAEPRLASLDPETFQAAVVNGLPARGMPAYNGLLTDEQMQDLIALKDAWGQGEQVAVPFKITDEVVAALFALDRGDAESARLRIQNALSVSTGIGESKLTEIAGQLERDNTANAHALLVSFNKQWPIGDPANGQALYAEKCAPCHGLNGEGGVGLALNPSDFVLQSTNAHMVEFIQTGRPGTAMAGFKNILAEAQIADIVAFLRSWNPIH